MLCKTRIKLARAHCAAQLARCTYCLRVPLLCATSAGSCAMDLWPSKPPAACCCPCSHHVCTGSCAMNPWLSKPPTHAMLLATSLLHLSCMPCCLLLPLPSPYLRRQLRRGLLCFVRLRRYEHMTLQQCLHGIRTRDIPWMRREKGEALSLLYPWGALADRSEQRLLVPASPPLPTCWGEERTDNWPGGSVGGVCCMVR